jgi:putative addiction module killer protein
MCFELHYYVTAAGKTVFREWFDRLRDRQAQARIQIRLGRLERGLLGDVEPCGEGVSELRIDWGPGYRVYFAQHGQELILLLCGGDKRTQSTDIRKAKEYWHDYQQKQKSPVRRTR